ncbi:Hypothetical predicted protein [Marmota monax]|uniref:Uncharacterized protein n=1 Tax=Marmota monax TaxID=9995 RepID=A0A5E4A4Z1_MARMO|nr:hypothetical protein GHT09_003151 [Marmota monax]VTJ52188.1 Hypothetical predicted protein [Marmota monax]
MIKTDQLQNELCKFLTWTTAGQEQFCLGTNISQRTNCSIIVNDITQEEIFQHEGTVTASTAWSISYYGFENTEAGWGPATRYHLALESSSCKKDLQKLTCSLLSLKTAAMIFQSVKFSYVKNL